MSDPPFPFRHVAVEGPIGVGKTSLVERLAARFSGVKVLEDVTNPFLDAFYRGVPGAAFQVQIFFLLSRYQQHAELRQPELFTRLVVADYTLAKDRLFAQLNLSEQEFALYDRLYRLLVPGLPKPDLVVYLEASVDVCLARIRKRGRPFERTIDVGYLRRLKEAYAQYFFHYNETPLLVVNTDDLDFVHREEDFTALVEQMARVQRGTHVFIPLGSGT
ncbi:MAG: deoxynucleoside kinase [Thermoanaerobaculum sp.]|nr:deoxynucleoside kinase [Thermoanaerobaculum sp.]